MRAQPLVLLIDDEDEFLEIASRKLQGSGFETFATTDAHEAIAKAEELQPDLVLSDIYMVPGPNGWEVALELHRNPKTRDVKFAFFTTLRDPWLELSMEARTAVAAELGHPPVFLSKIDDVKSLGERINTILNNA
jgi:CheY-like chemotaxis protein